MKKLLMKGFIVLGVYLTFTAYLLFAVERIERLEINSSAEEVLINSGD